MAFPIMGVALYLLVGLNGSTKKMRIRFQAIDDILLQSKSEKKNKVLTNEYFECRIKIVREKK